MAWSWSHSAEAYADARTNVERQPREWLETVFAEWHAHKEGEATNDFSRKMFNRALVRAKTLPDDTLADFIWEKMEELATCTNGGHQAHCCPFGCGCHMVSFDLETEEGDES